MNALSRETFEGMDEGSKLNILFDYVSSNHKCACETQEELTELKQQFERRKKFDTTVAGAAGVVGGIFAHIGQWIIGGKNP